MRATLAVGKNNSWLNTPSKQLTRGLLHHRLRQLDQPPNALASALGGGGALGGRGSCGGRRLGQHRSRGAALGSAGSWRAGALDGRGSGSLAGGGRQDHHLGGGGWLCLLRRKVRGAHHHDLASTLRGADRLVQPPKHNHAGLPGGGSLRRCLLLLSRLLHGLLLSILHLCVCVCLRLLLCSSLALLLLHLCRTVQHHLQVRACNTGFLWQYHTASNATIISTRCPAHKHTQAACKAPKGRQVAAHLLHGLLQLLALGALLVQRLTAAPGGQLCDCLQAKLHGWLG